MRGSGGLSRWSVVLGVLAVACSTGSRGDSAARDTTVGDASRGDAEVAEVRAGDADAGVPVEWSLEDRAGGWAIVSGSVRLEVDAAPFAFRLLREAEVVLASGATSDDPALAAAAVVEAGVAVAAATGELEETTPVSARFALRDTRGTLEARFEVTPSADGWMRIALRPTGESPSTWGFTFDVPSGVHWYGLGQLTDVHNAREGQFISTSQHFPLDAGSFERPVLTPDEGTGVMTPLWLTATGVALFSDSYRTLSVAFGVADSGRFRIHARASTPGCRHAECLPDAAPEPTFALDLLAAPTTRAAYESWVARRFAVRPALPVGARPADDVFTRPIWTTWAQYKQGISAARVLELAHAIVDHGYDLGYLEIDDRWTPAWGDLTFDPASFPDAPAMIDEIHGLGAKVSLWVPPFVNKDAAAFEEGAAARAYVAALDVPYPPLVAWWDSLGLPFAGTIDVTREEGCDFWGGKVDALVTELGVDGFKYDAGETQFLPKDALLAPGVPINAYPDAYARFGLEHAAVEVRAAFFAQDLPVAFRQFDKGSRWGLDNGLAAVVTQYLAMGLVGYPFILPDMVGGNEYGEKADDELFLRWVALNAFLPMIQLSVLPWRSSFGPDVDRIARVFLDRRASLAPYFLELADEAARTQLPLVRPLFFEFPDDARSYAIGDEYMLGPRYLVAPVVTKGVLARHVYLPPGTWRALDAPDEVHEGPLDLADYPAPIDRIPVFERVLPGAP